jgi:hypothetical protein
VFNVCRNKKKPGDEPGFLFVAAKTNRIMPFILLA